MGIETGAHTPFTGVFPSLVLWRLLSFF